MRSREQILVRSNPYMSSKDRINSHYGPSLLLPGEIEEETSGPLEWSFLEKKEPALHMPSRFIWRFKLINLNLNFIIDETELELDSNKESGPSGENYT